MLSPLDTEWVDGTAVAGCSFVIHVRDAAAATPSGLCVVLITRGESGRWGVAHELLVSPLAPPILPRTGVAGLDPPEGGGNSNLVGSRSKRLKDALLAAASDVRRVSAVGGNFSSPFGQPVRSTLRKRSLTA